MDLGAFSRRMNKRANNFDRNANNLRRSVAMEMIQEVVLATPVDTGVARSNWRVTVNSAPTGVIGAYSPGQKLGRGETANANAAIAAGIVSIMGSKSTDVLYFTNNVPYIQILNTGYSKQAPSNFISKAFDRARKRVQRARRLLD